MKYYHSRILKRPVKYYKAALPCDRCGKKFNSKHHLKNHIDSQHKNMKWYCKICPIPHGYSTIQDVRLHLHTKHKISKKFEKMVEVMVKKAGVIEEATKPDVKVEPTCENSPKKDKENSLQCESCNQYFDSEKVLSIHKHIAHD